MTIERVKAWESDFWGFPVSDMKCSEWDHSEASIQRFQTQLQHHLDETSSDELLKFALDARQLRLASILEQAGFELWETRFVWLTLNSRAELQMEIQPFVHEDWQLDWAEPTDHNAILQASLAHVAHSSDVITRFDSPFYPQNSGQTWYSSWIQDVLKSSTTLASVVRNRRTQKIGGFFIYQKKGEKEGVPVFKGILASVEPELRGMKLHLHLQQRIFDELAGEHESVWLDNTTQISNYPIIRNHVLSNRRPEFIELVFFKGPHRI
jgi:hypothetical protein